jgi:HK97 family phage portal protein
MGLLARLEQRATVGSFGPPRDPLLAAWLGAMNTSATGITVTPDSAMRATAVYRCVKLLAETYASLPLGVYKELDDGGKQPDRTHPLYELLHDRPNRWQTSFEWREMMSGHFALRNRCYSEIVSTGGKGVAELVPLHPDRVRPFRAPDGRMAFEYTPIDGPSRVILQSEMHYMHGLVLDNDGVTPLSPIAACRESIGLSLAAEEHTARLFGNGTRLGGILKMPAGKKLGDDPARERLLKSWKDAQSGLKNVGKTALLEDGLEWEELGMTAVDAQLAELRKLQLSEIARIWGVPPHKIGDLDRSTNNNIEHQGIEWVTDTIRPGAVRWEQALKRDLFYGPTARTHCPEFNLDALMRGDSVAQAKYFAVARQWGWMNADEIRAKLNMNPLPDGKGKIYIQPLNMVAAGKQTDALLGDGSQDPAAGGQGGSDGKSTASRLIEAFAAGNRELAGAIRAMPAPSVNVAPAEVHFAEGAIKTEVHAAPVNVAGDEIHLHQRDGTVKTGTMRRDKDGTMHFTAREE